MTQQIAEEKRARRDRMRAQLKSLDETTRVDASAIICRRTLNLVREKRTSRVGVYLALPTEANLDDAIRALIDRGVFVAAPLFEMASTRAVETQNAARFARLDSLDDLEADARNGRVPRGEIVLPQTFDVILVPGLAFDESGTRLGRGGGWYDRALNCAPQALKIGVAFECQIVARVPCETHDIQMDYIVTEERVLAL